MFREYTINLISLSRILNEFTIFLRENTGPIPLSREKALNEDSSHARNRFLVEISNYLKFCLFLAASEKRAFQSGFQYMVKLLFSRLFDEKLIF